MSQNDTSNSDAQVTKVTEKCPYCKSVLPQNALKCAQCGEYVKRNMSFSLSIGILLLPMIFSWFTLRKGYSTFARIITFSWLIVTTVYFFTEESAFENNQVNVSGATAQQVSNENIGAGTQEKITLGSLMPEQEKKFIATMDQYVSLYAQAENELKKSTVWKARDAAIKNIQPSVTSISDWVGVIEEMGTTSDGDAYISIRISDRVVIKTWNNTFSDFRNKTLISHSSPLYNTLAELNKGDPVKFSATLLGYANLTEAGKVENPECLAKFSSIKPI
ncbi:MAG: hypothetical protein WC756_10450 [Taibaiella sp.]|jgi:hypothetical protein